MHKINILVLLLCVLLTALFSACNDSAENAGTVPSSPEVVSGSIQLPDKLSNPTQTENTAQTELNVQDKVQSEPAPEENKDVVQPEKIAPNYDGHNRTDPFLALIQEKTESTPIESDGPQRILTPLEKIDLTQIRLTAIIIMKKRQIAMVEDADGKGYEVSVGTYIGKNQGKVSDIKDSSIIVTEFVKDYQGRIKERVHEIKLHKNNEEG